MMPNVNNKTNLKDQKRDPLSTSNSRAALNKELGPKKSSPGPCTAAIPSCLGEWEELPAASNL